VKKSKGSFLYRFLKLILTPLFKFYYNPKIINKEYLKVDGPIVVAGNHKHTMDQCSAIISTNRLLHYMAKKEYFDGEAALLGKGNRFTCWLTKVIVKSVGCIPVDRSIKDDDAKQAAIQILEDNGAIGIFPEGTRNKTDAFMLPFKFGTVSLAAKGNASIIPFGVTGDYKFRSKNLYIRFGPAFKIDNMTLEEANDKLYNEVKRLMEENLKEESK
jgi:1-acyl-sn-glycerol-3-phosphate acyltransferase